MRCFLFRRKKRRRASPQEWDILRKQLQENGRQITNLRRRVSRLEGAVKDRLSPRAPVAVRLVTEAATGKPQSIFVDGIPVPFAPGTDKFRLLWLLAEQNREERPWVTLDDAVNALYGPLSKYWDSHRRTLKARLYDLRHKAPLPPHLIEERIEKTPGTKRSYRLNASVVIGSTTSKPKLKESSASSALGEEATG